jgi:threonine/homoserine/homoserine lactone efflux protein
VTESAGLPLHDWETFYVIIGSSAAALTGLMFVVVALTAERRRLAGSSAALDSYATPTVVHFCAALLLAAVLSTPGQTPRSLGDCILIMGAAGLVYGAIVLLRQRRQSAYEPVLEDWIWHVILPFTAYASLLVTGLAMRRHPEACLYVIGATELLLLFIGIHNAWDAAVYITTTLEARSPAAGSEPDVSAPAAPTPPAEPPADRS